MAKLGLSHVLVASLAASLVAGCDNGAEDAAQGSASDAMASESIDLNGTLDRSFAGETIPAVVLLDPDGESLDLAEVDAPVLMNLWATWCVPCIAEMPLLDELAADLDGQVRVLTVSEDLRGAEVVVPFFEQRELKNLPRWMDQQNELAFSYGGGAVLPLTILYDAQGNEIWRVIGAYDWSSATAREEVLEALASADSAA